MLLHHLQELDNNLGDRADQNLLSATLLSVGDDFKAVGQDTHANHLREKGRGRGLSAGKVRVCGQQAGSGAVGTLMYGY